MEEAYESTNIESSRDEVRQQLDGLSEFGEVEGLTFHEQIYNSMIPKKWNEESMLPKFLSWTLVTRELILEQERANTLPKPNTSGNANLQPECRHIDRLYGLYIPRICPPYYGYPCQPELGMHGITDPGIASARLYTYGCVAPQDNGIWDLTLRIGRFPSVMHIVDTIENSLVSKRFTWVIDKCTCADVSHNLESMYLASCYTVLPLHVFDNNATIEIQGASQGCKIMNKAYDECKDIECHPGAYGTLQDNSLIDVRPYSRISLTVDKSMERDVKRREQNTNTKYRDKSGRSVKIGEIYLGHSLLTKL